MFIDAHVHPDLYEIITPDEKNAEFKRESLHMLKSAIKPMENIFAQMEAAKMDKFVLLGRDYSSADGKAAVSNDDIALICKTYPDKFIGVGSVDPSSDNYLEEAERAFTTLGLRGLKLHPGRQSFYPDDERLTPLYELCEKYDRPIVFHSGMSFEQNCETKYSHPFVVEPVAMKHKNLRICLAHFGWPWVRETAMLMLKYSNVYADTAALYFDSAGEFMRQTFAVDIPWSWIDRSLRHQVMFGSNYPRFEQRRLGLALETLGYREETLELIKGQNALEFYGLI